MSWHLLNQCNCSGIMNQLMFKRQDLDNTMHLKHGITNIKGEGVLSAKGPVTRKQGYPMLLSDEATYAMNMLYTKEILLQYSALC